jgi:ubiquinone/menaquinone biosynthesis C-methylase UbiE
MMEDRQQVDGSDGLKDTESYYDEFADWYENDRHDGYHVLIDELQTDLVLPMARNATVLEVGCGTGLILRNVAKVADYAVGIDISDRMLQQAQARGLRAIQGSATEIPFEDERFDLVYSFKVLSHVRDLDRALSEMARTTRPGGRLILDFYNPWSLRYLAKRLKRGKISPNTTEAAVFTRFDSLPSLRRRLPSQLEMERVSGVRVLTPHAIVHRLPLLRTLMARLEWKARDSILRYFGGFLALHLRRR